jgi:hypothetical protein
VPERDLVDPEQAQRPDLVRAQAGSDRSGGVPAARGPGLRGEERGVVMAIVVDSVDIRGLRKTHFEQLMDYLLDAERLGSYYGNYGQYRKRHTKLKAWLQEIIDLLNSEGVVVPKKEVPCEADGG